MGAPFYVLPPATGWQQTSQARPAILGVQILDTRLTLCYYAPGQRPGRTYDDVVDHRPPEYYTPLYLQRSGLKVSRVP